MPFRPSPNMKPKPQPRPIKDPRINAPADGDDFIARSIEGLKHRGFFSVEFTENTKLWEVSAIRKATLNDRSMLTAVSPPQSKRWISGTSVAYILDRTVVVVSAWASTPTEAMRLVKARTATLK